MPYHYFIDPFAEAGDKTAIPETSPPDGSVSYATGYGPFYEDDLDTDPNALAIQRDTFNELMFVITEILQQYQQHGCPEFITTTMNGGTPHSYSRYDSAETGGNIYQSLVNSNTTDPTTNTTNWRLNDFSADKVTIDGVTFAVGVANGDIVYWDTGTSSYDKALADGTVKQNVVGIADVVSGRVFIAGQPSIFVGLTPNIPYYLSGTVAGAVTATPTAGSVVFLGISRNTSRIVLNIAYPSLLVGSPTVASVYLAAPGGQSIPGGNVPTLIEFDSTQFDTGSLWQGSPTYSFKIVKAGYYNFSGRMLFSVPGASSVYLVLFKNGVEITRLDEGIGNINDVTLYGANVVYCAVNDEISLYATNANGVAVTIGTDGVLVGPELNAFQLTYIGS